MSPPPVPLIVSYNSTWPRLYFSAATTSGTRVVSGTNSVRELQSASHPVRAPSPQIRAALFYLFRPVEFEFSEEVGGAFRLRYANGSEYKNESKSDVYIRKETRVHRSVVDEVKRFIAESSVLAADDTLWPEPDSNGLQELEITLGTDAIFFNCAKIGALSDIKNAKDPKTLTAFYYLVQDLKCLVFSLISVHFKIKRALRGAQVAERAAPQHSLTPLSTTPYHTPYHFSSSGLEHGGTIV